MRWRIRIQVRYRRGADLALAVLALAALLAGLLSILMWKAPPASASPTLAGSPIKLQYYLTTGSYFGNQALSACAPGYHMASLWEILDTSNLHYNTSLGRASADSGHGPPYYSGWIRTGYSSNYLDVLGEANCQAWTSNSDGYYGTTVSLPSDWIAAEEDLLGWNADSTECSLKRPAWCVGLYKVFLPLILRGYAA
ncbi:MAG: hypothetical protein PVH59_14420 [Anaerolineae bacterium]|jgi:hypothetical protein